MLFKKIVKKEPICTRWLPKLSTLLCLSVADNCNAAHSPCAVHDCPPGKVCYLQQVQCIAAPCPPVPACKDQDYDDYNWLSTPVQLISWSTDFRIPSSFLGGDDFETRLEGWPSCWTIFFISSPNLYRKMPQQHRQTGHDCFLARYYILIHNDTLIRHKVIN